jgi:3-methyladenine DNA glycosylase AlkD
VKVLQTSWCHSTTSLWQKRASLVAFVQHSTHPAVFPIATTLVSNSNSNNDRFIMTAIGWVLRCRSETDPKAVVDFVQAHDDKLSEEAKNMMTAKMNDADRRAAGRPTNNNRKRRRR